MHEFIRITDIRDMIAHRYALVAGQVRDSVHMLDLARIGLISGLELVDPRIGVLEAILRELGYADDESAAMAA